MLTEFSKDENKTKEQLLKELKVYRAQLAVIEEAKEAQRKAEEALEISKTSYQEIFEKANDGIAIHDIETGRILSANEKAYSMIGYTKEEFLNSNVGDFSAGFEPYTQEHALSWIKKAATEGPQLFEWLCKHKDGHLYWVQVNLKCANISGQKRLLAIVRDITARKQSEEELKKINIFLDSVFENIPNMVFVKDAETLSFERFNKAAENVLGYSREELIGKNDYDFYPKEQADFFTKKDREALNNKNLIDISEEPVRNKSGEDIILHTKKIPILDGSGKPKYLLGISEDITEKKQLEEKLKESEMLHRLIAISTSDAIWDWDLITNKVKRISGYKETYGYEDTKQLDNSISWWHKQIHPDDIERVIESINSVINNKEKFWTCEYRHLKSDGKYAYVLDSGCLVFDENEKPIRMIGCTKNITFRKQAEDALKALNESLEHKVSERTQDLIKVNKELRVKVKAHQQALDVMKEQETGFRLLFTNNPNPMLVYDLKTLEIIEVNDTLIKNYGYTRDELLSMKITDIRPEEDISKLIENVQKERTPLQFSGEWRHKLKNREIIDVEITSHTADFNGRKAVIVSAKDITKRKEAEAKLQVKTDQLSAVTEAMTLFLEGGNWRQASSKILNNAIKQTESEYGFVGVVVEGPKLRILAHDGIVWDKNINREFYEKAVQTYKEVGYLEFANFNNLFGKVITTGKPVISNTPEADPRSGGRPAGHPALNHFLGVPILKGSEVVGMIGVANRKGGYTGEEQSKIEILTNAACVLYDSYRRQELEISLEEKRKVAEIALRESEEKYRSLINNIPDVTWTTDSGGNTIFVSPNVEQVYGYSASELCQGDNCHWYNRIHPEDLKKVKEAYGLLITTDKKFDVEYRMKRKDGKWIWIHDRAISTYEKNGKKYVDGILSDITIKKLEQKAIIESEERYRRLIETADDAIIGWSTDKFNVSWNKAAERIYGYTKEEIKNKHVSLIVPEDRKDEVNKIFEKIEKGERIENFETIRVRKDGAHINVSLTISPIRDSNGKTIGLSTIARDITAQKKAHEELAETQRKLTTLIGHMPGFAYRCANDPDWTMEYLTEGFFLLTGYKPKELINNNVIPYSSLIVPEHRKYVWDTIQKALAKKEQYILEYRIRTKQGKEKWVWEKGSGIFDGNGKLIALEGFILNITERKKSEETKSLLASIVDSSNDAIVSDTADGIILSWNSGAEKMYGYTKDEIIGKHFSIVVPPECKSEIETIQNKINLGESIENYETIRMRKDGKRIYVSLTISPLKSVNGIVTGICGIARDITVQRELQKELEKAKQREQHEKEIKSLEELARLPKKPDVTVQLFGLAPLQKSVPGIFNDLVERYEVLIDKALEDDQSTGLKNTISDELRIIGDELCTLKAGPSDVMEIHSKVMKNRNKNITSANAQAFTEKTRFMVLELMGHLVSYYRKHSLIYKEASSAKSPIKM